MKSLLFLLFLLSSPAFAQDQQFIFVFLNRKPDKTELPKEELDKIMAGHMANIGRLAKEGKLISAGPFDGGGGIFIFKTMLVAEAREWLSSDPGIQARRWNVEMFPYSPRVGSACPVGEPYEMVTYDFIRYTVKAPSPGAYATMRKHEEYLKKISLSGNVVAEGTFGDDGGILVMKGALQKEILEADPSLAEGLYQIDFKKLYIAKGAFCEK